MNDKTVPQSIEAEEAVLGALLIDPAALAHVLPFLKPDDFYLQKHRWIYEAIMALHEQREPLDLLTLATVLERSQHLEGVGGSLAVAQLVNVVPSAVNVESYGQLVAQAATRRRLLDTASDIARLAYDAEKPVAEVLTEATAAVLRVQPTLQRGPEAVTLIANRVYNQAERALNGEHVLLPTGLPALEAIVPGWDQGTLTIIAGRPGWGKTSLLLNNIAEATLATDRVVLFFSLEMPGEELVIRQITARSGITPLRQKTGQMSADDWTLYAEACAQISELPLIVDDTPALTVTDIRARTLQIAAERPLALVCVDYLQKCRPARFYRDRNDLEVGAVAVGLKDLAKELRLPVVAASQLSRAVEQRADKKPVLSDLRESGQLEQEADIVIFINPPGGEVAKGVEYAPVNLDIAKHRQGPTGERGCLWQPGRFRFVDQASRGQ